MATQQIGHIDHLRKLSRTVAAILCVLAAMSSHATDAQQIGRTDPILKPLVMATLEGSLDWGDLGPDWQKELSIYGGELLLFRWTINATTAAKGRWEIAALNGTVLAQGEVNASQTPGTDAFFSINTGALGISPPFKVRIQALTAAGGNVGLVSPPVIVNLAVNTGFGTCFTDGGLGLPIADKLAVIRIANGVPALGGAIVTKHGLEVFDAVGIRKVESSPTAVTKHDKWHLGSDTKAMTSMLVGLLRQQYPFSVGWGTTIAQAFPEWAGTMDPTMAQTTLRQLLAHRSGLYLITEDQSAKLTQQNLTVVQQRKAFAQAVVHDPHVIAPGVLFKYSNANYVIAGAMLENIFHQSWEDLITQYLFQPLGMASAGFGAPAQNNNAQPWGHYDNNGVFAPTNADNPPSLGPAGTVHASLADWAKFIRLYLKGNEGGVTLTGATLAELTKPYSTSDPWFAVWPQSYGWGWGISETPGDKVLGHDGSNTLWYARAVVYMDRGYALLAVANAAAIGEVNHGLEAVGDVVTMLEAHHSACPDNRGRLRLRPPQGRSNRGSSFPFGFLPGIGR